MIKGFLVFKPDLKNIFKINLKQLFYLVLVFILVLIKTDLFIKKKIVNSI